jgi:ABC-type sugar transport system ATPase subunit
MSIPTEPKAAPAASEAVDTTAALGVAQTAEVLNLVERLRDQGLGVILISHNMADVQAVADRIVVLRLGRNGAEFRIEDATTDTLVAAITGASDNVVTQRAQRHRPKPEEGPR